MVKRVEVATPGGPEVMQLVDCELPEPGPGMARVAHRAIGINFIDTYHRSGLYPLPLPTGLGLEAAGIVEAVGEGVDLAIGSRVAYCAAGIGAYSEALNVPASRLVAVPDEVDFEAAAAVLLKGATVEALIQRCFPLQPGQKTLFHAAAGGVGLLFGQWAADLGAEVMGTVGSEEKRELALANGYSECLLSSDPEWVEKVKAWSGGGVPVVYDGVGAATFEGSLDCLAPRGMLVSFGNASGPPPPLELQQLALRGSLYVTRPSMMTYVASDGEMRECAAAVFDRVARGVLKPTIAQRYPLAEVQRAHRELEARKTVGSSLLLP